MGKTLSISRSLIFCLMAVFFIISTIGTTSSVNAASIPGVFSKTSPSNSSLSNGNVTLSWGASKNALSYEYCLARSADTCSSWIPVGKARSKSLSGLINDVTYYWQVRAVNLPYYTDANGSISGVWSFTVPNPPGSFNKYMPSDSGTTDLTTSLAWTDSSDVKYYQVCYALSPSKCTNWTQTGSSTFKDLNKLKDGETYFWQVRAVNANGLAYADGSPTAYSSFHSQIPIPGDFYKTTPPSESAVTTTSPTLSWTASSNALSYQVCYSLTPSGCTNWTSSGKSVKKTISNLKDGFTYYWQVRAINKTGITYANSSAADFWTIKIQNTKPGLFNKTAPNFGSSITSFSPILQWSSSVNASTYEICYSTSAASCTNWTNIGNVINYQLVGLTNSLTYYWQVRAKNAVGLMYANNNPSAYFPFSINVVPGVFGKIIPQDKEVTSNSITFSWSDSNNVDSYEICYSTNSETCNNWIDTGAETSYSIKDLQNGVSYYWQVRGINKAGISYADSVSSAYFSFDTSNIIKKISAGYFHTCALSETGDVYCWGSNIKGQLGDGTFTNRNMPVKVIGLDNDVTAISSGGSFSCVLTKLGGVKCWGYNENGQLGDGTYVDRNTPAFVKGLELGVKSISVGNSSSCALIDNGNVKCWGFNSNGTIGDGTNKNSNLPVEVILSVNISNEISVGANHVCALTDVGGAVCWGNNANGELGDGSNINSNVPVDVIGLAEGEIAISSGGYHTCSIDKNNGIKCWGYNEIGQLGIGSFVDSNKPVIIPNLSTGVIGISTGYYFTCAVTRNLQGMCWGQNDQGQLGDGTNILKNIPVSISGLSNGISNISAGGYHSCAITIIGGVLCWGKGYYGQLGNGSNNDSNIPVDVFILGKGG